jgi:alpha-L-rhamnosidase
VLGVTLVEPGWKSVRIQPIADKLEFARGVVPSPHGLIRVEWERSEDDQLAVRIDLPEGMSAQFIDPLGEKRNLEPGSHEFHT